MLSLVQFYEVFVSHTANPQMQDYVAQTHLADRMAVVGLGVEHDALVNYAKGLGVAGGDGSAGASAYGGGEVRQDTGAPVSVVAVAGAGAR